MVGVELLLVALPVGFAAGLLLIALHGVHTPVWVEDDGAAAKKDDDYRPAGVAPPQRSPRAGTKPVLGAAVTAAHPAASSVQSADVPPPPTVEGAVVEKSASALRSDPAFRARVTEALFGHTDTDAVARAVNEAVEKEQQSQVSEHDGYRYGRGIDARRVRYTLDACALMTILAVCACVLVYEYNVDPLVELVRLFPREAAVINEAWSKIRAIS